MHLSQPLSMIVAVFYVNATLIKLLFSNHTIDKENNLGYLLSNQQLVNEKTSSVDGMRLMLLITSETQLVPQSVKAKKVM